MEAGHSHPLRVSRIARLAKNRAIKPMIKIEANTIATVSTMAIMGHSFDFYDGIFDGGFVQVAVEDGVPKALPPRGDGVSHRHQHNAVLGGHRDRGIIHACEPLARLLASASGHRHRLRARPNR
jgi:hypothetical protein